MSEEWLDALIEWACITTGTTRIARSERTHPRSWRSRRNRSCKSGGSSSRCGRRLPIAIVDAYWDDKGQALCPMATGISHHISPYGDIEPCPIIQFAKETIHDRAISTTMTGSAFLSDFRETAAKATRGCIVLERPDLVRELVAAGATDTTQRNGRGDAELEEIPPTQPAPPANEVPEENWAYRFAKKHWFFGFGAYS